MLGHQPSKPPASAKSALQTAWHDVLQIAIGYEFKDLSLLIQAMSPLLGREEKVLAHQTLASRPAAGESDPGRHLAHQRLEFLGDRVLGIVIAHWLFERFPCESEGHLTDRLTTLVERGALQEVAFRLGIAQLLSVDDTTARSKVLSDICEALIGAIYLDGGEVSGFVRKHWTFLLERHRHPPKSAKSALQEWTQKLGKGLPVYRKVARLGEDHNPLFEVRVEIEGEPPATGSSGSIRSAETIAAQRMLKRLHDRVKS